MLLRQEIQNRKRAHTLTCTGREPLLPSVNIHCLVFIGCGTTREISLTGGLLTARTHLVTCLSGVDDLCHAPSKFFKNRSFHIHQRLTILQANLVSCCNPRLTIIQWTPYRWLICTNYHVYNGTWTIEPFREVAFILEADSLSYFRGSGPLMMGRSGHYFRVPRADYIGHLSTTCESPSPRRSLCTAALTIEVWLASSSKHRQVALATSLLMNEKGNLRRAEQQ